MAVKRRSAKNEYSLLTALKELCGERDIDANILYDAIETALVFAYKKTKGAEREVEVKLDRETGTFKMFEIRPVVEEISTDDSKEISLQEARKINPTCEVGDLVRQEVSPEQFGRIAAQSAKQLVVQKIREAERGAIYNEFNDREDEIITGSVERIEDGSLIIQFDKATAILVPSEQIRGEHFEVGDRIRAYVAEVRKIGRGPQIFLSRTHPGFLKKLLELEVPEIQEGIIVVKAIAREAGARSKIAVYSTDENIEPVGTCIGPRGIRIQNILSEIGEEKIDVVQWNEEPAKFIASALSPSKVLKVAVNQSEKASRVIVPDDQLSLAIGKEGQNARLAARLTGWKIDIKSQSQAEGEVIPEGMVEIEIAPPKSVKQVKKKKKKKKKSKPAVEEVRNLFADETAKAESSEIAEVESSEVAKAESKIEDFEQQNVIEDEELKF